LLEPYLENAALFQDRIVRIDSSKQFLKYHQKTWMTHFRDFKIFTKAVTAAIESEAIHKAFVR
jgi:hypothetical protein